MKRCILGAFVICGAAWADVSDEGDVDLKSEYAGGYIGLGLNYQREHVDVTLDDNFGYAAAVLGGISYNAQNVRLNKRKKDKLGGTFNLGYGDFVSSDWYLGADLTVDISKNREFSETNSESRVAIPFGTTTVKNTGTIPTLAARFGAYIPYGNVLAYTRFGAALIHSQVDVEFLRRQFKSNRLIPVLGFGFEKSLLEQFSLKLEADYRCVSKKKVSGVKAIYIDDSYAASVESEVRGYIVRIAGVYHF